MNRREFLTGMTMTMTMVEPPNSSPAFRTRGVYFHDGFTFDPATHAPLHWELDSWRREIRWLHELGLNAVEFATMLEFNRPPSTDMERRKIADKLKILDYAHALGMQFG